ncbi:hypothetical protein IFM89_006601 [Coptis chinensis]|uniref:Uncharacterized protein n=1 Tax=Coptis chinensis TaxID=261450 RepID=A0A835ILI8_9MAGN|nr:hypothetical protein IFM89_006601 [Coptis chinensis]
MGTHMLVMKITALLLISVSLFSLSYAGRQWSGYIEMASVEMSAAQQEAASKYLRHDKASDNVHERVLRVNTKDYGTYDPTPTLNKPPFKLIPN